MRQILASVFLIVLLFPALALGETMDDLVKRNDVYFKKFTDVPFTGNVTGKYQGSFKNGKMDGPWVKYHKNGQLSWKGTFKDGKSDGPWVGYNEDGTVWGLLTGTFKDGKKVE